MRALRLLLVSVTALLSAATEGRAEPVFLLHAMPSDFSLCDAIDTPALRCGDLNAAPSGSDDYFAWVIVGDVGGEIRAAAFGITYDSSVSVASWLSCGGQQIPTPGWPGSNSGIAMTMQNGACVQTPANDMVKLGFFFVTSGSRGAMRIVPHPHELAEFGITDCSDAVHEACQYNGRLVFDGTGGYVPDDCRCSGPPAVEASWGGIKNEFRDP